METSTDNTKQKKPSKSKDKPKKSLQKKVEASTGAPKIGIEVKKEADFSKWYQQVLVRSEMLEYYDVSGCYIIRPWAYNIWKVIQAYFDDEITKLGVEDAYFPMFVSHKALEKEKNHIEGFAPEVAWVTKAGNSKLEEPIAIRPTSETVMYPIFSKWIRSHRDLPLKLNQWCSVVRWEFKHPQPFIRTREFLWQEGHTAYLTFKEAEEEVHQILDLYASVYEDYLAIPVIKGIKSENEKFAGGLFTTTCEVFIPTTGRGLQGGTSHCLGQNFSKMFDITVEDPNTTGEAEPTKLHVWQNSWGLSTRTIGALVMVHGDDKGLILPPKVANIQVVVIPCGLTSKTSDEDRQRVNEMIHEVIKVLKSIGVKCKADLRENYTPGYKFNHWELRGVPLRIEIGPKDVSKQSVFCARRDISKDNKQSILFSELKDKIPDLLEMIQKDMFEAAKKIRDEHVVTITEWDQVMEALDKKCLILGPWCEGSKCEDSIKDKSSKTNDSQVLVDENGEPLPLDERAPSMGAKSLCIPLVQPEDQEMVKGNRKCFGCDEKAKRYGLFGRSY